MRERVCSDCEDTQAEHSLLFRSCCEVVSDRVCQLLKISQWKHIAETTSA